MNSTHTHLSFPTHCKSLFVSILFLGLLLFTTRSEGQTVLEPGEIMFIGYNSDAAGAPPPFGGFSIVLLTNVVSGTVIYFTDRGWSNTTGFRNDTDGEGTISFTFTANFFCSDEIIFSDLNGTNDWQAKDEAGNVTGTIAILSGGDIDGMELNATDGDQLIIYQLPEPTAGNQFSFVSMIQMDNSLAGIVNNDWESELPAGLTANDIVRFVAEWDDAKYDCTPNAGNPQGMQAAISNDDGIGGLKTEALNNWAESNTVLSLSTSLCGFCCGAGAPPLSAPSEVIPLQVFTINITGTLPSGASWELYTAGCGSGSPLQTTMTNTFTVTAPGSTGNFTYYIRPSSDPSCSNSCSSVSVCVVASLMVRWPKRMCIRTASL